GVSRPQLGDGVVYAFSTETVSTLAPSEAGSVTLGRRWLARLIAGDGAVRFAVDPRPRGVTRGGAVRPRRAAIVGAARGARGTRARERLEGDAAAALRGKAIDGWPDEPAKAAGTLALIRLAGALDDETLLGYLEAHREVAGEPWHAAQCVTALGARSPGWL